MGWDTVIDAVFAAYDAKSSVDQISSIAEFADKLSKKKPEDIKQSDLDFFTVEKVKKIQTNMSGVDKALDEAKKITTVFPECNSLPAFDRAMKAGKKYGFDSKEAEAAIVAYRKVLIDYAKEIAAIVKKGNGSKSTIAANVVSTNAMVSYGKLMVTAFENLAKLPSGQGAEFFVLSRNAAALRDISTRVNVKFKGLKGRNDTVISEGNDLIRKNQEWILWTYTDWKKSEKSMTINSKAKGMPVKR